MANRNRTEVSAAIEALAAVVDLEELKEALNDFFAKSCIFRKDVTDTDTAASSTKTLNFLDVDYVTVTQSTNVTYTLNNIQQGEIKYLKITKTAGQTIDFSGATDISARKSYINSDITEVIYEIVNKDGSLYVNSINIDNGHVESILFEIGDWNMDTSGSVTFAHNLNYDKIIGIESVLIRNDTDANRALLYGETGSGGSGGFANFNVNDISLQRISGGIFDNTNYDSTSYNRGWVILKVQV